MRRALSLLALLISACSSSSGEDCSAMAIDWQQQAEARVDFYRAGCMSDSDCTTIEASLSCVKGCPSAVLAPRKSDVQADLDALSGSVCAGTSCNVNIGCNPSYAACVSGRCRTMPGVPDAGADGGSRDGG